MGVDSKLLDSLLLEQEILQTQYNEARHARGSLGLKMEKLSVDMEAVRHQIDVHLINSVGEE